MGPSARQLAQERTERMRPRRALEPPGSAVRPGCLLAPRLRPQPEARRFAVTQQESSAASPWRSRPSRARRRFRRCAPHACPAFWADRRMALRGKCNRIQASSLSRGNPCSAINSAIGICYQQDAFERSRAHPSVRRRTLCGSEFGTCRTPGSTPSTDMCTAAPTDGIPCAIVKASSSGNALRFLPICSGNR